MKALALTWICLLFSSALFSQKQGSSTIFFKNHKGEIYTQTAFEALKSNIVSQFKEKGISVVVNHTVLETAQKGDSLINSYDLKIMQMANSGSDNSFMPDFGSALLGHTLPRKKLTDLNGDAFPIGSVNERPTVINFWFTSCKPCIAEMPILNFYKEKYGNKIDFVAITFEDEARVKQFLTKKSFNYVHLVNAKDYINQLNIKFYPTFLYLDKNGNVKYNSGNIPLEKGGEENSDPKSKFFEDLLQRLLSE